MMHLIATNSENPVSMHSNFCSYFKTNVLLHIILYFYIFPKTFDWVPMLLSDCFTTPWLFIIINYILIPFDSLSLIYNDAFLKGTWQLGNI